MEKRTLGRTGWQASILGLGAGGMSYGTCGWDEGIAILQCLLDGGVNYIDCAASYQDREGRGTEERVGEVMKTRRAEVFLSTKTMARTRQGAAADLKRSRERLHTDVIDQVNFHNVSTVEELDQLMGPEGALAALEEAQRAGVIRFIGITGHRDPHVLVAALRRYPFATVLVPINLLDQEGIEVLGPVARQMGVPMISMKTYAQSALVPFRDAGFRYTLSQPGVAVAAIGTSRLSDAEENLRFAESFQPLSAEEQAAAIQAAKAALPPETCWWKVPGGRPPVRV